MSKEAFNTRLRRELRDRFEEARVARGRLKVEEALEQAIEQWLARPEIDHRSPPNEGAVPEKIHSTGETKRGDLPYNESEAEHVERLLRVLRSSNPVLKYAIQTNLLAFEELSHGESKAEPPAVPHKEKTPADKLRDVEQLYSKARDALGIKGRTGGRRKRVGNGPRHDPGESA